MQTQNGDLTGYDILEVHPAAPPDLITAAYWRLAGRAQAERAMNDPLGSAKLWTLTRAYEVLSRPPSRAAHDQHYGIPPQPLTPSVPPRRKGRRRSLLENGDSNVDYYEILRVAPGAEPPVIEEAYSVLRNLYIRLVKVGSEPRDLIDCLEEAWAITSDAERRQRYDEARERRSGQAKVAPPVGDPAMTSGSAVLPATPAGKATPDGGDLPKPGLWRGLAGGASSLMRRVARQWSIISMREMEQVREAAARRHRESAADIDEEDALVQRLSSGSSLVLGAPDDDGARASAKLELVDGPGRGASYELARFPLTLGGDEECDIALPALAEQRARLLYRDGRFVVYSLAGASGSEVDGDPGAWRILESGEDLRLGPYTLRFTISPG